MAWGLQIEHDKGVLLQYLVETRTAELPAFPGFCPGRWSNEGIDGNIIDVGGGHSGHSSGNREA